MEPEQPLASIPENMHTPSASDSDICFLPARQMADLIRQKKLSAREVMQAHLKQIERVNPKVNAIVTLVPEEQLMAQALSADEATAKGNIKGPLHGLPVGVKDLHPTKGIRTTFGSPLHKDDIPNFDCLVVEREKNSGAIVIGKTNVPEWGLGSQTFNPVFGPTLNPYDLTKTCGGSTGGGSVALAFSQLLAGRNFKGVRVAMFQDMGLPWEPEVRHAVQAQRKVFESLGCIVEEAEPDFSDANECFVAWRHWSVESQFGDILEANSAKLNEYVHWHVEEGRKLTGPYLARVETKRTALYKRMREFMEKYEFFILPVNQVLPFDVKTHYPVEIAGVKMENYIAWMKSAYYISVVGNPAISVPCAFSESGLPIGIQIVGRHNDDWGVLQMAYSFEQATKVGRRRPAIG
jgi:Asp-tRNA(Asn)/Glu-tRNA(Gln) amidotransferase A subunit family amidase